MKNTLSRIAILLVVLTLGITSCSGQAMPSPTASPVPKPETAADTIQAMLARMNAGDLDGAMNYFADDAKVYFYGLPPTGTEIYLGKDALRPVFEENIASHFQWESEIVSTSGDVVNARAKTWHDFIRQIGIAPVEATEIYEVKDGKIRTYAWTITDTSLAKLKAALAGMPAEEAPAAPAAETPVSDLAVTISNGTCSYEGPLTLNHGQVNVTVKVLDQDKVLYALSFFTLNKDRDFMDLMASTALSSPPVWSNMFSIVEVGPGASKSYTFTAREGPIYAICWSQPPDMPIGAFGPFAVASEQAATEPPVLATSVDDLLGIWATFCPPAHENCSWEFREDGTYRGALIRIPGAVFNGKFTFQKGQITFETDSELCSEYPQATYEVYVARENGVIAELQFTVVGEDQCKDRRLSFAR